MCNLVQARDLIFKIAGRGRRLGKTGREKSDCNENTAIGVVFADGNAHITWLSYIFTARFTDEPVTEEFCQPPAAKLVLLLHLYHLPVRSASRIAVN